MCFVVCFVVFWLVHFVVLEYVFYFETFTCFGHTYHMQFPPLPSYLVPLRPKYLPQHPILEQPRSMFLPQCERPSLTPTQNKRKIIVLYISIFVFLDIKLEDKIFCTEWQQAFPDFNILLISWSMKLRFVRVVPKYLKSSTISKDITYIYVVNFLHAGLETLSYT
jgi:hypothetical protein